MVGYHTSKRNSTQLITYTFRTAFVNRKASAGLVFHSDRGAQYTSYTLRNLLIKLQVTQSFSRPGVPHDNAVAESFFSTLKREFYYRTDFHSVKDMKQKLGDYIDFYNTIRPHKTLHYKTPNRFEQEYDENYSV